MSFSRALLIFILIWVIAFTQKDRLPPKEQIRPELLKEPEQIAITESPLTLNKDGETYEVAEVASYDLSGLVVSLHHSTWMDNSHKDWKDYLNVADLCVVYGDNITTDSYRKVSYSHGDWTCYYSYSGNEGADFKNHYFSNNHILVDNASLEKEILSVRKGDQIHLTGFLVNYRNPSNNFSRKTSLTRDDTGDGACEIIYVKEFQNLNRANPTWRLIFALSKWGVLAAFLCMIFVNPSQPESTPSSTRF
jgi:hypothetical protein